MSWHLTVVTGNSFGARIRISDGDLTIGRGQGDGLVLDDARASRAHCRVVHRDGGLVLEDLGSTNGTRINGQSVTGEVVVRDGDSIGVGESEIRAERSEATTVPAGVGLTTKAACCRQTEALIDRLLDAELADELRTPLDRNVASCSRCAEQVAVAVGLRAAIATSLVQSAPDHLERQVRERLGLGEPG